MNLRRVLITVVAILLAVGTNAQVPNRTDICQKIPNLTLDQQKKIDKLSATHQLTMDGLRAQFYEERDGVIASGYKAQMNTEMQNHYKNISTLLTADQQTWFDQTCNVNRRSGNNYNAGYGRSQGYVRGQSYARGQGYGRGQSYARGQGYGRSQSYARGQGYGRGQARFTY